MTSVQTLENLGRKRLSPGFFLRDFMHSEIAQVECIGNLPVDSGTLVRAGTGLCEQFGIVRLFDVVHDQRVVESHVRPFLEKWVHVINLNLLRRQQPNPILASANSKCHHASQRGQFAHVHRACSKWLGDPPLG